MEAKEMKDIFAMAVVEGEGGNGWEIFVGTISWEESGFLNIKNAEKVLKREKDDFGIICRGARSARAKLEFADDQMIPLHAIVTICPLPEGWRNL
jgi:hypothetical protein